LAVGQTLQWSHFRGRRAIGLVEDLLDILGFTRATIGLAIGFECLVAIGDSAIPKSSSPRPFT